MTTPQILPLGWRMASLVRPNPRLPYGATGVWYCDQFTNTPRPYVPNFVNRANVPKNVMNASRRWFSNGIYSGINATVADEVAAGATSGRIDASTLSFTSTGAFLQRSFYLTAGTYTFVVVIKRNSGIDKDFKIITDTTTSATKSATAAYQRFPQTFTVDADGAYAIGIRDAGAPADFFLDAFELYAGSSDLGPEIDFQGHLGVGYDLAASGATFSGGVLDMSAAHSFGFIQFPTNINLSAGCTVIAIAKKIGASASFVTSLTKAGNPAGSANYDAFGADLEYNVVPDFRYAGSNGNYKFNETSHDLNGMGWHCHAHRYNNSTLQYWLDGAQMLTAAAAPPLTPPTVRDFFVSSISGSTYGSGYQWYAIAFWPRVLSDAEMVAAQKALFLRGAQYGVNQAPLRVLLGEGDSISARTYTLLAGSSLNPKCVQVINATSGSFFDNTIIGPGVPVWTERIPDELKLRPSNAPIASKYIVSFFFTNGVTNVDTTTYMNALKTHALTFKNAGWLVALGTVTPRSAANTVGYTAAAALINPQIRALEGGAYCDKVIDFDALNLDTSDTTIFSDGGHFTSYGNTLLAPVYYNAINAM